MILDSCLREAQLSFGRKNFCLLKIFGILLLNFKFFTNFEAGDRGEYPSTPGRRRLKGKAMCASFSEPKVEKKQVQGNFRTENLMRFEP